MRFQDLAYDAKQLVMHLSLASEVNALSFMLDRLSEKNRWYRDFTLNALTAAVREFIACFPVYRTYVCPEEEPTAEDRAAVKSAVRQMLRRNPGTERSIYDFVGDILLKKFPENIDEAAREAHMRFVMKFQQCSSPVMAKGVEDTAFYIYNRLTALNEVGGEPQHFSVSPERFHQRYATQLREHPHSLLATSTHDTKRSEDTRTRIAAISEIPMVWRKSLRRWQMANQPFKREIDGELAPDANEEHLLYQTLLGTWPLEPMDSQQRETYIGRIQEYMIKACKEAKVNSSWIQPNEEWEAGGAQLCLGHRAGEAQAIHQDLPAGRRTNRATRSRQFTLAARAQSDRAGCARHLPRHGALDVYARGPRQPSAGGLRSHEADDAVERRGHAHGPDAALERRTHQVSRHPRPAAFPP